MRVHYVGKVVATNKVPLSLSSAPVSPRQAFFFSDQSWIRVLREDQRCPLPTASRPPHSSAHLPPVPLAQAFASSFHTGSQPFRFVLGSDEAPVAGWNEGLVSGRRCHACPGVVVHACKPRTPSPRQQLRGCAHSATPQRRKGEGGREGQGEKEGERGREGERERARRHPAPLSAPRWACARANGGA